MGIVVLVHYLVVDHLPRVIDILTSARFDITNGMSRPQRHLKLAIGLDYLDACPVRGMRRGGGSEQMHARVYVSPHALQTQQ